MAFGIIAEVDGATVQVDYTVTGSRAIRVTPPARGALSLRLINDLGILQASVEWLAGQAAREASLAAGLRNVISRRTDTGELDDYQALPGWRISIGTRRV